MFGAVKLWQSIRDAWYRSGHPGKCQSLMCRKPLADDNDTGYCSEQCYFDNGI